MQLINSRLPQCLSIFILAFLMLILSAPGVLAIDELVNLTNNDTLEIIQNVDTAISMPTELDFIRTISIKIFLPSVAAYWLIQFVIILIIGLLVINKDKDTYFVIFVVTQLIGALILFFIFVLPIVPEFINNLLNLF